MTTRTRTILATAAAVSALALAGCTAAQAPAPKPSPSPAPTAAPAAEFAPVAQAPGEPAVQHPAHVDPDHLLQGTVDRHESVTRPVVRPDGATGDKTITYLHVTLTDGEKVTWRAFSPEGCEPGDRAILRYAHEAPVTGGEDMSTTAVVDVTCLPPR